MLVDVFYGSEKIHKKLVTILDSVKNWGAEGEGRRNLTFCFMPFSTVRIFLRCMQYFLKSLETGLTFFSPTASNLYNSVIVFLLNNIQNVL